MIEIAYNNTFGNQETWDTHGGHIGDMFNGILSLVSVLRKNNVPLNNIQISSPLYRQEIVNLFGINTCAVHRFNDLHVHKTDMLLSTLRGSTGINIPCTISHPHNIWDYFSRFDLTGDDIVEDYCLSGDVRHDITSDDIIIFPMSYGANIIHYNIFLEFIKNNIHNYRNIYWNIEPEGEGKVKYRINYPKVDNKFRLNLGISDLITTLYKRNPTIIGCRSGLFDIMFHILKTSRIFCFCDTSDIIQSRWRFKENCKLYQNFQTYIKDRVHYNEIKYK